MVTLGDKVRDPVTTIEGRAYCKITYEQGCDRIGIQQLAIYKKGEVPVVPELFYVDEPQLEVITKTKPKKKTTDNGGPSHFGSSHKQRR